MAWTKLPENVNLNSFKAPTLKKRLKHFFNKEDILDLLKLPHAKGLTVLDYVPDLDKTDNRFPAFVATHGKILETGYDQLLLKTDNPNLSAFIVLGCPSNDIPTHVEVKYDKTEGKFVEFSD